MSMQKKIRFLNAGITAPKGFRAVGIHSGIKLKKQKKDLALVMSVVPATAAGIFTRNVIKAAPVLLSCQHLRQSHGRAQVFLINSGNANCMTGHKGYEDACVMLKETARLLNVQEQHVLVASTGVIGRPLPIKHILSALPKAVHLLSDQGGHDAAEAILTTDTKRKEISIEFSLQGKRVRIAAMAKGAGMISPKMATLIVCITTDIAISSRLLQRAIRLCTEQTLNAMSIDGDMSTNDTVCIMANGLAGNSLIDKEDDAFHMFIAVLDRLMRDLTLQLLYDGEGVTKVMEIYVQHAATKADAEKIARTIGNSSLVKTAIYGNDPNWGRIAASAGASGVVFHPDSLSIWFGKYCMVKRGSPQPVSLGIIKKEFQKRLVKITIDINTGEEEYTFFSTDLTEEYVKINASYTT